VPGAAVGAAGSTAVPSIGSDEPYSPWEHLWFPQLRSPTITVVSTGVPHLGAVIGGGDRLGMQRWSLGGHVQLGSTANDQLHWGGQAQYLNMMLAPWQILAVAGFIDWIDPVSTDDPDVQLAEERRTRDASLSIGRTWRGTVHTELSGVYTEDIDRMPGTFPGSFEPDVRRRLGGPSLALSWVSGDSTPYTGLRRALVGDLSVAYYPHDLSSFAGDIYDTRGALRAVLPLPFGRRHTLVARVRGRALITREDTGLLQLGGTSSVEALWNSSAVATEPPKFDEARFPPNLRFIELLRGYEDYAITTDRAAIADLTWRYPLIIDRGYALTFGVLPASYVRELDFELFAAGAVDQRQDFHTAIGAAVSLRFRLLFHVPVMSQFVVTYQLARRLHDDEAITQLVGLGTDL
jgi:hypothetical protein